MYSSFKRNYIQLKTLLAFVITQALSIFCLIGSNLNGNILIFPPDTLSKDSPEIKLKYPIKDRRPYQQYNSRHPLDLSEPANIKNKWQLDDDKNEYNYESKVGPMPYRLPASSGIKERLEQDGKRNNFEYFKQRSQAQNFVRGGGLIPQINLGNKVIDRIFGSGIIDIRPRGTAELIFQGNFNTVRNPAFAPRQQRVGQFDFRQKIQINVTGSIGDKLRINMNYDTEATFEFENQMKLDFGGKEDDIIKKIELGNVNLPLNSALIQGSQSLFGVKTTMQFGKLQVTAVVSQQRGRTQETELTGGAMQTRFDIQCDNYDMNRHYFLSHYFRDHYDEWLRNLPFIGSPVVITRVEVWVTNRSGNFDNSRDVMGFTDLGEAHRRENKFWQLNPNPTDTILGNRVNSLWDYLNNPAEAEKFRSAFQIQNKLLQDFPVNNMRPITEYQILNFARQLGPNEFTFNPRLGYISLNQALNNDDVLCVAYEGVLNGVPFKVGEFSLDIQRNPQNPEILFTKMLKGPSLRPDLAQWDLMMKNIYSLGSFQIQQKDFKLQVIYADDPSGANLNYIPARDEPLLRGTPLISVLNLDNLNTMQERAPDGLFDYIEGITINSQTGRVIFPVLEPFGSYLKTKFSNPSLAEYYCFPQLYDSTRFAAIQLPQFNKFFLRGSYQGSSTNEISLGSTNVPRGSVRVTANGAPLTENSDYIVDYNLGRVKIINTALLNSGAVIRVSSESNNLFMVQQRSLLGTRLDYKLNRDVVLGSTFLYLNERPLTPKVNIGEEPISNVVVGLDGTIKKESRFITKLIDKLPFYETKEPSQVTFSGEYARLIPGIQGALQQRGTAYLDDFEGAETPFDLRMGNIWSLASTPQGQPDLFPEGFSFNSLEYGKKRANLNWYTIATTFYRNDAFTPRHLRDDPNVLSNHRVREVLVQDIFKSRQIQQGMPATLPTFDLTFYPNERGPYNYNVDDLLPDGKLQNPQTNWGGIMRKIDQNDFEQANIDYIEIWMMDPFADKPNSNDRGYLYFNLGNISEDILRDNRRSAENGLPRDNSPEQLSTFDTTAWGRVPRLPVINYAFDADPNVRQFQDVGLDGMNDEDERGFFAEQYLNKVASRFGTNTQAYQQALADPSNDNYRYYLGTDFDNEKLDVLQRYKRFNMHQGNSPTVDQSTESYPTAATNIPDNEDLNRDFTINDVEEYFQYKVEIARDAFVIGRNFVTDTLTTSARFINGNFAQEKWYQLKIPIAEFERRVGGINDFRSIRFIRMYMRGFSEETTLRFATMQLVRADWRKYLKNLEAGGEHKPIDPTDNSQFVVSTVNIEKNSERVPVKYVVPPGIQREIDFSSPQAIQQNEQSLSILTCNLRDGDARAVFKPTAVDLRLYGKLRMFLHAEGQNLKNGELTAFIRLGTDLTNNYYEYEIPLQITPFGANDPFEIWPQANEMVINLEDLVNVKIERTNANWPFTAPYTKRLGNANITVIGLPDFSQTRVLMLGVRNPKRMPGSVDDDGLPKCGEVWFNELRMTDFSTRGGDAATGRLLVKLADLGNAQITGAYQSVGWGGIDKKLLERSLSDNYQYDIITNVELGRFLPRQSGLSVPFFFTYGNTLIRPLYNPLNPDTRLQKELDETINEERVKQISRASDDFTMRKGFNFTNVRKNRVGQKKAYPWDIENISLTYGFNELFRRNQELEYSFTRNYMGMLMYNYTFVNKPIEPFKNIKNKNLALIKDFNLNYLPASWGFRVETDRRYGETLNRNNDDFETITPILFDKMFTMRRNYELRYGLSRNLKIDYIANADTRIDEPLGRIGSDTPEKRDSIKQNFFSGGRIMKFDQTTRLDYNIPINKIPIFSFISQFSYNYAVNYQWLQAPPAADSLGNTIQNSVQEQWNLNMNLQNLYNKVRLFREVNNPLAPAPQKKINNPLQKSKDKKENEETKQQTPSKKPWFVQLPVKLITSVKNINGNYSTTNGSLLPGFNPRPQHFGQNFDFNAPGFDFIFGLQSEDYRFKAARNGWISNDPRIVNPYVKNYQQNISARATIEPWDDIRIDLNATKNFSNSLTAYFRYDPDLDVFRDFGTPIEMGTYSISYNTFRTSFSREGKDGVTEVFRQFEANRLAVAKRIGSERGINQFDSLGFPIGYGAYQQDVLIPAFLSAYRGVDPNEVGLTALPSIPLPNWRLTYNGLTKYAAIKEWFTNVSINHAYQSTYSVGGFQTVMDTSRNTTVSQDFQPDLVIRQVSIVERFGPFIGIDVTLTNNVTGTIKYNKDRTLNFALGNRQLSEQMGEEFQFGIGYRTTKLVLPFKINGRRGVLENDINFRLDFSIRENVTKIRYLDRVSNDPVLGQTVYSLRPNIDYMINEKLMLRIFYDRRQTNPFTSNSFPTIITSGGFSLRYTIQ
ncbi:MAG: cell surface protein SprA [Bacteroidia bacterium]